MNKISVLMVGPDSSRSAGGMASVIRCLRESKVMLRNCTIVEFPSCRDGVLLYRLVFSFISFLRFCTISAHFDVCHIHIASYSSTWRKMMYGRIAHFKGMKVIYHVHGAEYKEFYASLNDRKRNKLRAMFMRACAVIVLSNSWYHFFSNTIGLNNVYTVYNSLDCDDYQYRNGKIGSLCFVGRIGNRKGVYDLLNALSQVRNSGLSFTCTFAGDGEIDRAEAVARSLGISDLIKFTNWVPTNKIKKLLEESSIMILPSYNEGFPVSILEAMASGNAIISTDVGGVREEVPLNGGLVIPAGNIDLLSDAIKKLLTNTPLVSGMSLVNREYVEANFDNKVTHNKIVDLYKEALNKDVR